MAAFAPHARKVYLAEQGLSQRLAAIQPAPSSPAEPCLSGQATRPLVLLVLGQSNAGNHGPLVDGLTQGRSQPVKVFTGLGCQDAVDPLPGATGQGASIWSRLPDHLQVQGARRPVVLALLAVDASSIAEWTDPSSGLKVRLDQLLDQLRQAQLAPDLVLWQQGEADARQGTSTSAYVESFERLRRRLRAAGVSGPLLLARSTRCNGADGRPIRAALDQLAAQHQDVRLGPDTDAIQDDLRHGLCHFSARGLDAAALRWAQSITALGFGGGL